MGTVIEGFVGTSAISERERQYIKELLPEGGRLIEIGTLHGVSVGWWADQRPDCEFLTIDPFRAGHGTGPGTLANWKKNKRENQRLFVGTLQDLHGFNRQFDIAFIDGDHEYNACKKDLEAAEPMIYVRGTMCVHDYAHRAKGVYQGVRRAVDEFCESSSFKIHEVIDTTAVVRLGGPPNVAD